MKVTDVVESRIRDKIRSKVLVYLNFFTVTLAVSGYT